jgi:hypothetical protein
MMEDEVKPQLSRGVALKNLLDCEEVLLGLGHFLSQNVQMACVNEVVDPLLTLEKRLCLCY